MTTVKEFLDNIMSRSFHNEQSGIRLVYYNVVKQVVLDMPRTEVMEESLDAHIAKYSDIYVAAEECRRGC